MIEQMRSLVLSKAAIDTYTQFLACLIAPQAPLRVMFHCQGGKDRTGWASALILGLLGVDKAVIYDDYLQTSHYNAPRNEKRMATYRALTDNDYVLNYLHSLQLAKPEYLDGAFQAVSKHYGSLENYATEALQFDAAKIELLKKLYLYDTDDEAKLARLLKF
jgi:protein-tyrosine phosphatase